MLSGKYSEKADVYSFGILLGEIWGLHPFNHFENMLSKDVIAALEKQTMEPLFDPQCPADIKELITFCIQRDEEKRPSFMEICEKLKS